MDKFNTLYEEINDDKTNDKKRQLNERKNTKSKKSKMLNEARLSDAPEDEQQAMHDLLNKINANLRTVYGFTEKPHRLISKYNIRNEEIEDEIYDIAIEMQDGVEAIWNRLIGRIEELEQETGITAQLRR